MSDKTNVDALTSAFGNGMSLDGGEQGGEPSPDTWTTILLQCKETTPTMIQPMVK